jgi:hypothetical protein
MANEIKYSLSFAVNNSGFNFNFSEQNQPTQTAQGASGEVVSVGTSAQTLPTTGVATLGYALFKNIDATNYVQIGLQSGGVDYWFVRLKAGETAIVRLDQGLTLRAKANTAAVFVSYMVFDD